ncbi:alpha/beta fold hydrolase [Labedella endophytica]|uniref:Alpha/beta hydrolase n=1 Tax=Labedella endophytica TaxID=1523160 RepID=A0A433JU40_9MICO|nr:alpha/beta hydrolase [Labedella endophytica]RUR01695.1 alpha/beta hydrolase [Labedella endophytica]
MSGVTPIAHFGGMPMRPGSDAFALDTGVGVLTTLRARPSGVSRGVVLWVPGFTGSKEDAHEILPRLADAGYDAWAYSQRGQADSARPADDDYSLDVLATDAVEVAGIVGAGAPVHFIGHSLGGVVARAAVLRDPSAFASLTMLCSGPKGWPGRHDETSETVSKVGSLGLWQRDNPDKVDASDEEIGAFEAFFRHRAAATADENLLQGAALLRSEEDTTDALRATGVPVLVAHGEHDDKWPIEWQRDMAERLGARYAVIPGGAHSPQAEAPEATLDTLTTFYSSL